MLNSTQPAISNRSNQKNSPGGVGTLFKVFYSEAEFKEFGIQWTNNNGYVHLEKYPIVYEILKFNILKK